MTRQDTLEDSATSDQVAESRANLEALEAAAADAEARVANALAQLSEARAQVATLEGDLADAKSAGGTQRPTRRSCASNWMRRARRHEKGR